MDGRKLSYSILPDGGGFIWEVREGGSVVARGLAETRPKARAVALAYCIKVQDGSTQQSKGESPDQPTGS